MFQINFMELHTGLVVLLQSSYFLPEKVHLGKALR